jgi:carbon storage regulator
VLVLSRQIDERIVIVTPEGHKIEVCLVSVLGEKARIGVEASRDIAVHRKEVYDAICHEHRPSLQHLPQAERARM